MPRSRHTTPLSINSKEGLKNPLIEWKKMNFAIYSWDFPNQHIVFKC